MEMFDLGTRDGLSNILRSDAVERISSQDTNASTSWHKTR
jgi:hypothetical protein